MVTVEEVANLSDERLWALLEEFLGGPLARDQRDRVARAHRAGALRLMAARKGQDVVGICTLSIAFSTYRTAPFATLDDLYVLPAWRGHGIARRLVEHAAARASAAGCRSMVAGCDPELEAMYGRMGFRCIGRLMAQDLPGAG